jgi:hypothetical protein
MGMYQLESDTSVFGKKQSHRVQDTIFVGPTLIISVHVDDILMVGLPEAIKTFKQALAKEFKIKDIGPAKDYLGIEIEQSHRGSDIRIHQNCYLKQVLSRFDAANFNFTKSPLPPNVEIDLSDTKFLTNAGKLLYQQKVGSLTYAMQGTRPDLAFSVSLLSRFLTRPTEAIDALMKGVLRYVQGSTAKGITYRRRKGNELLSIEAYTDSDFAGKHIRGDARSTSGYVMIMAGGAISWSSKRQPGVPSNSSTHSEYRGQGYATRHIVHLSMLMNQMHLPIERPIKLNADNTSAIALAKNPEFHTRTKHIDVAYHFQRYYIRNGLIQLHYIPTSDMVADGLTKPLNRQKFAAFVTLLGLT